MKLHRRLAATLLLLFLPLLTSCASTAPVTGSDEADTIQVSVPEESIAILYVNQRLGFTMALPQDWLGQIEIEEEYDVPLHDGNGSCITVYHRPTHESEGSGVLFFVDCFPGDWSAENPPVQAGGSTVVLKANDCTYLLRTPSDVQSSETDGTLAAAYEMLFAQLGRLCGQFHVIS